MGKEKAGKVKKKKRGKKMNEYETVVNHIQEVTAIAKRFDIADKPEVLEYLTLVQLHAVKRDRTRVIDNKMKEVNDELERLEGDQKG